LAGASNEALSGFGRPQLLSTAQSLATYYLEFPPVKQLLDSHFDSVEKYAGENLSKDLRDLVGSARDMIAKTGAGRPEENLLSIVWNIVRQGKPFPIDQAIESFAATFLYGASMPEAEVERLWGIQVQTTVIPLMEVPLAQARVDTVSEIAEMVAAGQSR
jgi:hypothetical protein